MGRRLFAMGVLALVVLAGCDWTQPGFNGANTGSDPTATAFTAASVGTLHQAWSVSGPDFVPAQLVASGGTLYASSPTLAVGFPLPYAARASVTARRRGSASVVGASPGLAAPSPGLPFEALAVSDGALRWTLGGTTWSSSTAGLCQTATQGLGPAVTADGILFFSSRVTCQIVTSPFVTTYTTTVSQSVLDAAGGSMPAASAYDGELTSSPVVGQDGSVYAARTWQSSDPAPPAAVGTTSLVGPAGFMFTPVVDSGGLSTPAIDSTTAYVIDRAGILYAINRANARVRWTADLGATYPGSQAIPTPSVGDDRVFVTTGSTLDAFDPAGSNGCTTNLEATTCTPIWSDSMPHSVTPQAPAIHAQAVVTRSDSTVAAYSTVTGAALWSAPLGTASGDTSNLGSPTIANGIVFVGTQDHRLLAFDLLGNVSCDKATNTCTPIWSSNLPGSPDSSRPIIAGSAIVIASTDSSDTTGTNTRITKFEL